VLSPGGADETPNMRAIAGALDSPVTTIPISRAALISGSVNVIRFGGGFGESVIGAISLRDAVSAASGCPSNIDAVCPSGPIPSSTRSNFGISESAEEKKWWMSFSYERAQSSREREMFAGWTCGAVLQTNLEAMCLVYAPILLSGSEWCT